VLDRLARSSRTRHIPVIVVTGSDQDGIEAYVRQLGAVAFVAKPIDHDALLAAVSEASAELLTVIHGAASKP
jgi:CheY-like chemotaxis protein